MTCCTPRNHSNISYKNYQKCTETYTILIARNHDPLAYIQYHTLHTEVNRFHTPKPNSCAIIIDCSSESTLQIWILQHGNFQIIHLPRLIFAKMEHPFSKYLQSHSVKMTYGNVNFFLCEIACASLPKLKPRTFTPKLFEIQIGIELWSLIIAEKIVWYSNRDN